MDILQDNFLYNPSFHRFADFLGLDKYVREDFNVATKVVYLYDWSKQKSGSDNFSDILKTAVKLKRDIGQTTKGKTLVNELYKWARLDEDSQRINKEKEANKERLTKEEEEAMKRQERILAKSSEWEEQKRKNEEISKKADSQAMKMVKLKTKEQREINALQSDANIKVKEIIDKPQSEEIPI
jgi:hypothetical protein